MTGCLSEGRALTHNNASPQVEDGHTRIANELLEAMCGAGFSARQWAVVMAVVRKTYGYGKKADDISLGQFSAMTGIAKPHVSRTVNDLIAAGVLRRSASTFGNSLSLNKRYKQWALGGGAQMVTDSVMQGLPKEQPGLPEQQPLDGVTETATQVTDSVTTTGGTDLVTGVTDSVRVSSEVRLQKPVSESSGLFALPFAIPRRTLAMLLARAFSIAVRIWPWNSYSRRVPASGFWPSSH